MSSIFKDLIDVNEQKRVLELEIKAQKQETEDRLAPMVALLDELKQRDSVLRQGVVETLKQAKEKVVMIEDKIIVRAKKTTLQIENPALVYSSMIHNEKIFKDLGVDVKNLKHQAFREEIIVVPSFKKTLLDLVEKYRHIKGRHLEGVNEQQTEYITIKSNKYDE